MNDDTDITEQDTDPRIVAMHQVVDLERQHERAAHEADAMQKRAAIVREELREARDRLSGLLGYPSNSGGVKSLDREEAARLIEQKFADATRAERSFR